VAGVEAEGDIVHRHGFAKFLPQMFDLNFHWFLGESRMP
jgi:hypothetical protein